jgi:hypothetical protein
MQEDKKNKRRTELRGGEGAVFSVSLVEVWKSRYATQHLPIHLPYQPDTYGGGGVMPMDGACQRRQLRAVPNSGNVPVWGPHCVLCVTLACIRRQLTAAPNSGNVPFLRAVPYVMSTQQISEARIKNSSGPLGKCKSPPRPPLSGGNLKDVPQRFFYWRIFAKYLPITRGCYP